MTDLPLLPTSLVGSYPQPEWLIDRARLADRLPPRIRARELWRIDPQFLEEALDDATAIAIRDQEDAGLDILTDGEIRRESYSNRFATALDGIDIANHGTALDRSGHPNPVPRVAGKISWTGPVQTRDLEFLKAHTPRATKVTVPGPFTMAQQAQDDYYGDEAALAMDYAVAVNSELKALVDCGVDVINLDEPYMQARPEAARDHGVDVLNRALEGIETTTAVHLCFGYAAVIHERPEGYSFLSELDAANCEQISIETAQSCLDLTALDGIPTKTVILGVLDLSSTEVETPEWVAGRIREAMEHKEPAQIVPAPDCGMKYLPRDLARRKLDALVAGVATVRAELGVV